MRDVVHGVLWSWLILAAAPPASGAPSESAEFRGPGGQGHFAAQRVPTAWGPDQNVAWKLPLPGNGWSSPVVHDGHVYLTTAAPVAGGGAGDLSLRALRIDASAGRIAWDREVFAQSAVAAPKIHNKNSHASPTPLVAGDRLYVHFGHQGTACLNLEGNVLWRNDTLKYPPVHGNGGSPLIVDDLLVFSCDGGDKGFVVALDRQTGKIRWRTERDVEVVKRFSFCTPSLITVNGQRQVISPGSNCVSGLEPLSGKEIWRVRYTGYSVIPRPVFAHGLLFIGTGYDSPSVMAIRVGGAGDVTETHVAWTTKQGAPNTPSLLVVGDELYMVSDGGVASCLDARTGQEHWRERLGGNFSASPFWADGKIYFQSEDGKTHVVKPGKTFERLAENSLDERTLATPTPIDGALFIRTDKHLYRIGER